MPSPTSALAAALRSKYPTPQAALSALGLDAALLDGKEEDYMTHLSPEAARRIVDKLKGAGKIAMDADPEEVIDLLKEIDGLDAVDPNTGIPSFMSEHPDDRDDLYETPDERLRDDSYDRRSMDARRRLGRDETEEEAMRREEEVEFKPDDDKAADRRRAMDAGRARRAVDARRRLGRDETEEERERREREDGAEDRRRAMDRFRTARDYHRARDAHHSARDALRRHADDWRKASDAMKRADDAHKKAMDTKNADDAATSATDRSRAEDARRRAAADGRKCADSLRTARDARAKARDGRRAADEPPEFKGMPEPGGEMVSKSAMDSAIESAIRDNDARHRAITAAMEEVRPKVGRLAMDQRVKDEGDVYALALDALGVPHAGITQVAALKQMFAMAPKPGADTRERPGFAYDSVSTPSADAAKQFESLFPGAASIGRF